MDFQHWPLQWSHPCCLKEEQSLNDLRGHSLLDHLLELPGSRHWTSASGGETAHRREEVHVAVAPNVGHVIAWILLPLELEFVPLKDRQ